MTKEEEFRISSAGINHQQEKQNPEISEEDRKNRESISNKLFEEVENFTEDDVTRRKKREKEIKESLIFELSDGTKISVGEINALVEANRQPYVPLFPNDNDFFKEMFRINWPDKDYKQYRKPAIAGRYINEIIYGRFPKEILPALQALNPSLPGGYRKDKLFQYLNDAGRELAVKYRNEAIELMKTCEAGQWYEFRKKMYDKYGVAYQTNFLNDSQS